MILKKEAKSKGVSCHLGDPHRQLELELLIFFLPSHLAEQKLLFSRRGTERLHLGTAGQSGVPLTKACKKPFRLLPRTDMLKHINAANSGLHTEQSERESPPPVRDRVLARGPDVSSTLGLKTHPSGAPSTASQLQSSQPSSPRWKLNTTGRGMGRQR